MQQLLHVELEDLHLDGVGHLHGLVVHQASEDSVVYAEWGLVRVGAAAATAAVRHAYGEGCLRRGPRSGGACLSCPGRQANTNNHDATKTDATLIRVVIWSLSLITVMLRHTNHVWTGTLYSSSSASNGSGEPKEQKDTALVKTKTIVMTPAEQNPSHSMLTNTHL